MVDKIHRCTYPNCRCINGRSSCPTSEKTKTPEVNIIKPKTPDPREPLPYWETGLNSRSPEQKAAQDASGTQERCEIAGRIRQRLRANSLVMRQLIELSDDELLRLASIFSGQ